MTGRLAGKVAIISGAARGIGAACATALAAEGAAVLVTDLLDETGAATVQAISDAGGTAHYARLDVTDAANWQSVVALANERFGRVDILINNAGIDIGATIEDARIEDFRRIIDINLFGQFHGMQAVIPAMRAGGGGSIINIASLATSKIAPTTAIYGASKAAVANLTKTAAIHLAREGTNIRVNSVHPGPVETAMVFGADGGRANSPDLKPLFDTVPVGRLGQPSEIAAMILYLASDESRFVTAAEFVIDGGLGPT